MRRRDFVRSLGAAALSGPALLRSAAHAAEPKFRISLAAWSVHKAFFKGEMTMMDQPAFCKEVGIHGLELVNTFFLSPQYRYLNDLKKAAADNEVEILLIMCDGEGDMAHPEEKERMQAAKNHHKWVDIAEVLGCHGIRCNSGSGKQGEKEAIRRAAESFTELCDYAAQAKLDVIIENHGGLSSYADELAELMGTVGKPNFGTLPDFGNFPEGVDRYEGVRKMMPYAKAVSAKCHDFDDMTGMETKTDYDRMMKIVLDAGFDGWVGIEYEGSRLSEKEGVLACKRLLERYR